MTFITAGFSLRCCLLSAMLLIFSWNEVSDAKAITQLYRNDDNDIIKKSVHQTRQQNCESFLNNYPMDCNATLLEYNITNILLQLVALENNLTALNNLFKKICVAKCIDPLLRYYECINWFDSTFLTTFIKQSACGTHNGDFCHVLYLNRYISNQEYLDDLIAACPFPLTILNCASANSDCKNYVSRFISNMGCCTIPYIGDVRRCFSNVSEPCPQYQGSSGIDIISPALWCLLVGLLSAMFFRQ